MASDLWHAYEMSWLDNAGKPVVRVGRFTVPASSPYIVESKSFKLYLNSLNSTRFATVEAGACQLSSTILAKRRGAASTCSCWVSVIPRWRELHWRANVWMMCRVASLVRRATAEQLQVQPGRIVEEVLYSHLLRSLCPVTGQPDWATVWLHYRGAAMEHSSLLQYIIAYREHQEFHEQCVERMFCDIARRCAPQFLHLQAFYTRRGGLDINPFRSTDPDARPLSRLNRQ